MEKQQLPKTNFFTTEEWDLTPQRVQYFVVQQKQRIEELEKQLENLQEKVNCNSKNSSIPPSTEIVKPEKKKPSKRKKRSRGGQKGHLGYSRELYPEEDCNNIEDHLPEICNCCGEKLSGKDTNPYRHQIVEIPPIELEITEHRLHQLECNHCGSLTRAKLPEGVCESGYGATVVALVSLMSGVYRHSHRYNWVDVKRRQLCWAHLKREFQKIAERSGASRQVGRDLMAQEKKLFRLWRRVRDGTLSRKEFQLLVLPIRSRVQFILIETAGFEIGSREKTPWAKTVRTCRQLLKVETALWLFVEVEDLEPTNNSAERAIRPAVLWKKTSFGSQSENGSIFVARMLTVVSSLRSQKRNVLDFLRETITAHRLGISTPSLIPTVIDSEDLEKTIVTPVRRKTKDESLPLVA